MPVICSFSGIKIYVYFLDHAKPHIHAQYAGEWVLLHVRDGSVRAGRVHPLALKLMRKWMSDEDTKKKLLKAWDAAAAGKDPGKIPGPTSKKGRR